MAVMCMYRLKASETGDYSFCFDNSFSQISTKVVYFELFIASAADDDDDDAAFANLPDDTDYDIKLEDFKVTETSVFKCERKQHKMIQVSKMTIVTAQALNIQLGRSVDGDAHR